MTSSTFNNLKASTNGGIYLQVSRANIYDSSFLDCTATHSSGIYADNSMLFMNNTVFEEMESQYGTIVAFNDANITVTQSRFIACNTENVGGAITLFESNLTIDSSTFDQFVGSAINGEVSNIQLDDVTM